MKRLLRAVFALLLISAPVHAQPKVYTLVTNGPTAQLLNFVILAEGFTAAQETAFTNQARTILNRFLSTPPYNSYRSYFNGFAIFVASAEAGSDHPSRGAFRNTYFNSTYDSAGLDRLLTIPGNASGSGKVNALLEQFVPEYDIALLLVNDIEYGGSGGAIAVASVNSSSAEIAIHEIGHSFALLGDEYGDPYTYPDTEEPNTTTETRRGLIKWRDWILSSTPIPTPATTAYASVVGLFEGAHYHFTGWYRPKLDCRMRTLNTPFCEVCKEAIVLSAYQRIQMIQSYSPASTSITLNGSEAVEFKVETFVPADHKLSFTWLLDGQVISSATQPAFTLASTNLSGGQHELVVQVEDKTTLVRTDPDKILTESRSWSVTAPATIPPSLSPIPSQTVFAGITSRPIEFSVSDPDTSAALITVSAESSDPGVVASGQIAISRNGTNYSLAITPPASVSGATTVTLRASDGAATSETSFDLSVSPVPIAQSEGVSFTDSGAAFRFSANSPATLILERSADLFTWVPVQTNTSSIFLDYTAGYLEGPRAFFRLRLEPQ